MPTSSSRPSHVSALLACICCIAGAACFILTGCGSGGGGNTTPPALSGNTTVTVLASSAANDQLTSLALDITGITLTNQAGKSVDLLTSPRIIEFMHLNGGVEPIATVSVPQDVYTSATISVDSGVPFCETFNPSGNNTGTFSVQSASASHVTSNLAGPITVTGTGMGLELKLNVSQSTNFTSCPAIVNGPVPFLLTPTFNVSPIMFAAQPTNITNGVATGLRGLIGSVNANGSFTVAGDFGASTDGPTWQVDPNPSAALQGITNASQLAAGMAVDMDAAIQPDGSLLPTRIAVYNLNTSNLSFTVGPQTLVAASPQNMSPFAVQSQGSAFVGSDGGPTLFSYASAVFHTSHQLTNLATLPFTPSFSAANMVPGQNILVTTQASANGIGPASTVTLLPQTINGTISAMNSGGGFTIYTVTLASYDLFPNLAGEPGQITLPKSPGTILVYADSNTQLLSANPPGTGNVARFSGMIFNDGGTLRMDCSQIANGVPE